VQYWVLTEKGNVFAGFQTFKNIKPYYRHVIPTFLPFSELKRELNSENWVIRPSLLIPIHLIEDFLIKLKFSEIASPSHFNPLGAKVNVLIAYIVNMKSFMTIIALMPAMAHPLLLRNETDLFFNEERLWTFKNIELKKGKFS